MNTEQTTPPKEEKTDTEKKPSFFANASKYLKEQHEKSWGPKKEPTGLQKRMLDFLQNKKDKSIAYKKWLTEKQESGEWKDMTTRQRLGGPEYEKKMLAMGITKEKESPLAVLFDMFCVSIGAALENLFCAACLMFIGFLLSCIPLLCIIGIPIMLAGFGYGLYAIFVVPFATFLQGGTTTPTTDINIPKNIIPDEGTQAWEEQQIEKIKEHKRLEQIAREQMEKEEQETNAQEEVKEETEDNAPDTEKMVVDLGFGKKVPFKDLPKHLQEQLLAQTEGEKQE